MSSKRFCSAPSGKRIPLTQTEGGKDSLLHKGEQTTPENQSTTEKGGGEKGEVAAPGPLG